MDFGPGDTEPSKPHGGDFAGRFSPAAPINQVTFSRHELDRILSLYGRKVAAGEWRDYAIDFLKDRAVFSVFRRVGLSLIGCYARSTNRCASLRREAYSAVPA